MGAAGSSLDQMRTEAVWLWKSGDDVWSETNDSWNQYTDPEIYVIEEAFLAKKNFVDIDAYRIDLKHFIQVNKADTAKQRSIKRVLVDTENPRIRATQRFLFEEKTISKKSFSPVGIWGWSKFLAAAGFRARVSDAELPSRVEAAAHGIVEEGKLIKKADAKWIAKCLMASKKKSFNEIGMTCVRLYTMESFLYELINDVMREAKIVTKEGTTDTYEFVSEKDRTYGKTLGPYCSLLLGYLWQNLSHREVTVYRAVNMEQAVIDHYKNHKTEFVEWDAFSSTTKSLMKAKCYGTNVIFRIKIPRGPHPSVDIAHLSEYPDEEEILMPAGTWVKIDEVTEDASLGVILIDLIK
ncbi:unnamed protein product [Rotaria magnacalcarata]